MHVTRVYIGHRISQVVPKDADGSGKCHCEAEFLSSLRGRGNREVPIEWKKGNGTPVFKRHK